MRSSSSSELPNNSLNLDVYNDERIYLDVLEGRSGHITQAVFGDGKLRYDLYLNSDSNYYSFISRFKYGESILQQKALKRNSFLGQYLNPEMDRQATMVLGSTATPLCLKLDFSRKLMSVHTGNLLNSNFDGPPIIQPLGVYEGIQSIQDSFDDSLDLSCEIIEKSVELNSDDVLKVRPMGRFLGSLVKFELEQQ